MALNDDHQLLLTALALAGEHPVPVTPLTPDGRSRWHSPSRLLGWGLLDESTSQTYIHKLGEQLVRRGLAARKTTFGVTRFALTDHGTAEARRLVRAAGG